MDHCDVSPATRATLLVLGADDRARVRIAAALGDEAHLCFAAAGEGFAALDREPPSLIVCDVRTPGLDALELCRRLKAHVTQRYIPIILLAVGDARDELVRALDAGADDVLPQPLDELVLRARVRALLRIREHYEHLGRARSERAAVRAGLSPREREVLDLVLLGRSNDEVGSVLGISSRTAKFHLANVLQKLGAESRLDLLRVLA